MSWINQYLQNTVFAEASDLHLSTGNPPLLRVDGKMTLLDGEFELDAKTIEEGLQEVCSTEQWSQFQQNWDLDIGYDLPGAGRFRVNLFMDRLGPGAVFRLIPEQIPTPEQIGLPKPALDLCLLPKGLILVTGPTGSGKSTTLATMIEYINSLRHEHIVTVEDPIEFVFKRNRCLVNQREVNRNTHGFKVALRAALREDPDVVLIGEMRDYETTHIALETAETGHLVLATLHTSSAASTVDRIINQFPEGQQNQIRSMLAGSLKGVISQTLCRKVNGGRVAAHEVLLVNSAVASLIRESKIYQIPSIMQVSKMQGMGLLNDTLLELVKSGAVDAKEAFMKAADKADLSAQLSRHGFRVNEEMVVDALGRDTKSIRGMRPSVKSEIDPEEITDPMEDFRKRNRKVRG